MEAITDVTVLYIDQNEFNFIFGNGNLSSTTVIKKFEHLSLSRKSKAQKTMREYFINIIIPEIFYFKN